MADFIDTRDIFYSIVGLALLGLTLQPALRGVKIANLPFLYVVFGMGMGFFGAPLVDPVMGGWQSLAIEHAAELIVIISLAGAGLAIDTVATWRNWQPTYRLLMIAMPLTILGVVLFGIYGLGLGAASAFLLAAAIAPTDPVLAQAVQVAGPGEGENPMQVALTAEAGLNDGLAFPFVYLSIAIATYGTSLAEWGDWGWNWLLVDVLYRVGMGVAAGLACGWVLTQIVFSRFGDAAHGAWNSIVMVLAATLLSYGLTEALNGYGFLAVFVCARAGRSLARSSKQQAYEKFIHHGADQLEAILLAVLLLWLGVFIGAGALSGWRWSELAFALGLIFVLRPVAGFLSLIGYRCEGLQRLNVAFFGIRGMGSVFYIAYAQNHALFDDIDVVWRIAALTILVSIIVHGFAANVLLPPEEEEAESAHPYREYLDDAEKG